MRCTTVAVIVFVAGCQPEGAGPGQGFSADGCRFDEVPGTATIVAVHEVVEDFTPRDCPNDPVVVEFDFVADDPNADTQGDQQGLLLGLDQQWGTDDEYVARSWVEDEGLTAGTEHRCNLRLGEGFCPDPFGVFPDVDYEAAEQACQPPQ